MAVSSEAFGMMGGAFFVSRTELLDWIKATLRVGVGEHLAGFEEGLILCVRSCVLSDYGLHLSELSHE